MRYSLIALLLLYLSYPAAAQCGTDAFNQELMQRLPDGHERYEQMLNYRSVGYVERDLKNKTDHWVIPVVFHVIHAYGEENISDAQIHEQIRILNEDFNRLNADTVDTRPIFKGIAANMQIEFRLARTGPNGECSSGITRTFSPLTDGGDQVDNFGQDTTLKGLVRPRWDHHRYLNIFVVKRIGRNWTPTNYVAGYAVFPWTATQYSDGVVIRHDFVGASGTSTPGRAGRTLTHEIGHWLGLFHPFQGGCTNNFSWTDQVDDTPPVEAPSYGCPLGNNTCHNDPNGVDLVDMVENFMDYSNGSCQNMFSAGQKSRVVNDFMDPNNSNGRFSVTDSVELAGVYFTGDCAPIADFHSPDARRVCTGPNVIRFSDESYNGPVSKWTWYFEGGDPAVSSDQHPEVTYSSSGKYSVKLVVENAQGKDSLVRDNYVHVFPDVAIRKGPFGERFEPDFFANDWTLENDLWSGWERTTDRGFASNAALMCKLSTQTLYDSRYSLILPPVDLSAHGSPVNLSFRHAYAASEQGIQDLLYIWASTNCGQSWSLVKAFSASNGLTSVGGLRVNWFPSSDADWGQIRVPLDPYAGSSNVWIRLEMRFRGGNTLYIDDINIAQYGLGLPQAQQLLPFSLFPNPAQSEVEIQLAQDAIGGELSVRDLSGRLLLQTQVEGPLQRLDCSGMAPGMYLIRVQNQGVGRTQRLIINR